MAEIRVPAHLQRYVTPLGIETAITFLMAFGGSYIYVSEHPQDRSDVVNVIGREATIALAKHIGAGGFMCPTGKPFIAAHLKYNKGLNANEIARQLHTTHVTVRKWLKSAECSQLDLFGT
ncbi:hypothetical protein [Rhizobium lusitanum]|uniref:Uncharacterized protein n=1 Tax=Rhizobium lusitanum TaxID=293958 RepID=A0A1C3US75_9HYPH|nr:hypothetical protein [Rhizobium lusitanum]SCB18346.1 hypothetical protein GA0061101_103251 [Rhizobium lusitanum]